MKVKVGDEGEIILEEVYNAVVFRCGDGDFGVSMRDGTLVVMKDGKEIFWGNEEHIRLFRDGNQWCALIGENLQEGIAGFGAEKWQAIEMLARDMKAVEDARVSRLHHVQEGGLTPEVEPERCEGCNKVAKLTYVAAPGKWLCKTCLEAKLG